LALKEKGLIADAIKDFTTAIALDPAYALAYNNRAAAFKEQGKLDRAIEDYTSAINLEPGIVDAYINLSLLRMGLGMPGNIPVELKK
jgi:tetratricopeptide (TPR) repeat protein